MAVPYIYIYRFSSPRAVKTIQSNRNGCKFGRVVPSRRLAENGNTWSHDHSPISAVFLSSRIAQGVIKVCAPRCIQPTPHKTVNTLSTFGFIACCAHRSRTNEATREAPLFVSENCARSPSTFPATPISKRVSTRFQFARAHGIISFFTRQRAANY